MIWLSLAFVLSSSLALFLGLARSRRDVMRARARMRPLHEEVEWLRCYGDVLSARHGRAIRFQWAITPGAGQVLFPRFVLQPLIEEAVMHGLEHGATQNQVTIRGALAGARGQQKTLVVSVEDTVIATRLDRSALEPLRRLIGLQHRGAKLRIESSETGSRAIIEVQEERRRAHVAVHPETSEA